MKSSKPPYLTTGLKPKGSSFSKIADEYNRFCPRLKLKAGLSSDLGTQITSMTSLTALNLAGGLKWIILPPC